MGEQPIVEMAPPVVEEFPPVNRAPAELAAPEKEASVGDIITLLGAGLMLGVTEAADGVAYHTSEEAVREKQLQAVRVALAQEVKKQVAKESTAIGKAVKPLQIAA